MKAKNRSNEKGHTLDLLEESSLDVVAFLGVAGVAMGVAFGCFRLEILSLRFCARSSFFALTSSNRACLSQIMVRLDCSRHTTN